ncbi:MAG: lamin tail domain-containing protein [Bacteroidota bacterium]
MTRPFLLALALLFAIPPVLGQVAGDVVLNEIMYDPPPSQPSGNEWVEVLNASGAPLDLSGATFTDGTGTSDPLPPGTTLDDGAYLVIVRDAEDFVAAYPGIAFVEVDGFPALNNSGDRPALVLNGSELDAVPYAPSWGGADASLERRDPLGPSDQPANFGTSTAASGGTPGAQNSLVEIDTRPPVLVSAEAPDALSIRLLFDEPLDEASAENAASYAIDGGIGAPLAADLGPDGTEVLLALAAALVNGQTYTVTASNIGDTRGNVLVSATASFFFGQGDAADPRDVVINEFLYDEPSSDNPGEFVELFNRSDRTFDLRDFTLNDGTGDDQPITDQPVFLAPGGFAVIVEDGADFAQVFPGVAFIDQPGWSALNNSGDVIVLKYLGTEIDSLQYVPSWGGEDASLERRDPEGPSSVAANWETTSDLRGGTPAAENSQFAPDVTGPQLTGATASRDGQVVTVTLDEPVEPQSTAGAFTVDGVGVSAVDYAPETTTVVLVLASRLPAGTTTVTASGLRDLLGNETASTSTTVEFTPDVTPPSLSRVTASSPTVLQVSFTEPVVLSIAQFSVEGTSVTSAVATDSDDGGTTAAELSLSPALPDQALYRLSVAALTDLAGNIAADEAAFFLGTPDAPQAGQIVITEIMFDPQNGSDGEYLEVLNTSSDGVFDLRTVDLGDDDEDGGPLAESPVILLPGEYVALVRNVEGFRAVFSDAPFAEAGSVIGLSNSGETLVLRASGVVLDAVPYDPDWHRVELDDATGISLERRDPAGASDSPANWSSSLSDLGGTPSAENTLSIAESPVEREASLRVTSPFAPTRGEAAEITVTLSANASLVRARIYDGGGREVRELEPGRLVGGTATLLWDGTGDDRRPLRAGIYVVLVESVDAEGGTTEAVRGAVVLARPE